MKKVNPYTLYLSGVLSESQYLDIVEKEEINEISSDLLNRAANAAASRNDSRGDRLQGKFGNAINPKIRQEFELNPNKIKLGDYDVVIKSIESTNDEPKNVEFEIKCDVRAEGYEIEAAVLKIGYFSGSTRNVKLVLGYGSALQSVDRVEFDRMNAMKLSKFISSHGGNIKPTELPML
jgi:hypothetical protein